jgi:hypothetical protein
MTEVWDICFIMFVHFWGITAGYLFVHNILSLFMTGLSVIFITGMILFMITSVKNEKEKLN